MNECGNMSVRNSTSENHEQLLQAVMCSERVTNCAQGTTPAEVQYRTAPMRGGPRIKDDRREMTNMVTYSAMPTTRPIASATRRSAANTRPRLTNTREIASATASDKPKQLQVMAPRLRHQALSAPNDTEIQEEDDDVIRQAR
jgi:hypothetical protein